MRDLPRIVALIGLLTLAVGIPVTEANHDQSGIGNSFADDAFENRWERLDRPVTEGAVVRTLWWGPGPYTPGLTEEYAESPGGTRLVQYFDKTRMEITDPEGNESALWYVTNGLLVVEMVEGRIQLGDGAFRDAEPAEIPVAGDPNNPSGPTYATLLRRLDDPARDLNDLVIDRIDREGNLTTEPDLANRGVGVGAYVSETGHSVAAPFWEVLNSSGPIFVDGDLSDGPLFQNPFYAVGFPITEPYWSTAVVAGIERDVLLQCFERRCLTYTPGNPAGFVVEAGNVGQHYHRWRYGSNGGEPDVETVDVFLIALGDDGQNGQPVGCMDSLIPVGVEIESASDPAQRVTRAVEALVAIEEQMVEGPAGLQLYNALAGSDLTVLSAEITSGLATVQMTGDVSVGGVCDEPRFIAQIRQTILQFDNVPATNVFLNDRLLPGYFGQERLDGGILATFDVNGEFFNLWTTNPDTIDEILALEAGDSRASIPNGELRRGPGLANHNAPWSWHLDPDTTSMAEVTIELCDGVPSYVEANLDQWIDQVGRYCPWGATLIYVADLRHSDGI